MAAASVNHKQTCLESATLSVKTSLVDFEKRILNRQILVATKAKFSTPTGTIIVY
jgi:hypothetical protein